MPLNVTNGMTVTGGNFLLTSGSVIIQSSVSTHVVLSESSNNLVVSSSVIPDTTESYTIGSQSKLWAGAYTQAVHFDGLASDNANHAWIHYESSGNLYVQSKTNVLIGNDYNNHPVNLIVNGTLASVGAITGNLTGNVTGNLTGLVESLYDSSNGVGSLAQLGVTQSGGTLGTPGRGTIIENGAEPSWASGETLTVTLDGTQVSGKWAILNKVTVSSGNTSYVMAVRIQ